MLMLVAVLFLGITVNGAKSWFSIAGFTLQPAEFAKFGTCLAVASYLGANWSDVRQIKSQLTLAGIIFLPMGLILLQPDAGSALVFTSFFVAFFREGLSSQLYVIGFTVAALFIFGLIFDPIIVILALILIGALILGYSYRNRLYFFLVLLLFSGAAFYAFSLGFQQEALIAAGVGFLGLSLDYMRRYKRQFAYVILSVVVIGSAFTLSANYAFYNLLEPHHQDRINVWLRPDKCDPQGSLYNVLQSKLTIGSGGVEGKGFLQGNMTKLKYVPEQQTDFIFCTIGEEQGFIGTFAIVVLFLLLLIRISMLAERQRSTFARVYAYGVAGILFVHFFVNIGMTMGLVPIIGIPLPFISYGGSSILGFTFLMALLLKLDSVRMQSF